jgi:hypothetical protein
LFLHSANIAAAAFLLTVSATAQVLSPPEILDPEMRALQEKHFAELKAGALEITAHQYPYRFYLSRTLDVTELKEQQLDQRSIKFANFQGQTVVQVTGNYFAAYSDKLLDKRERVKRTYLDVVMPIVCAIAPRLMGEARVTAYAVEISHHVRKEVLGVTVESIENLVIVVPRGLAEKAARGDVVDRIGALRASSVYVDGSGVALWPEEGGKAELAAQPAPAPLPPPVVKTLPPAPARDLSQDALARKQASYQDLLDRIVKELDASAHFVSYAPPSLVAFHKSSYLQLSVTTALNPADAGSQYKLAALAFDRHISHLIRPLLGYFKDDCDFDGVVFSSSVKTPAVTQSVEFFFSLPELRRYEQYDITGQQLISSGYVLINGERIGLDLQSAEADVK